VTRLFAQVTRRSNLGFTREFTPIRPAWELDFANLWFFYISAILQPCRKYSFCRSALASPLYLFPTSGRCRAVRRPASAPQPRTSAALNGQRARRGRPDEHTIALARSPLASPSARFRVFRLCSTPSPRCWCSWRCFSRLPTLQATVVVCGVFPVFGRPIGTLLFVV
jgi:hypothetical protein